MSHEPQEKQHPARKDKNAQDKKAAEHIEG
jgi:hypothetical protein